MVDEVMLLTVNAPHDLIAADMPESFTVDSLGDLVVPLLGSANRGLTQRKGGSPWPASRSACGTAGSVGMPDG
jgi:hypothetical protein